MRMLAGGLQLEQIDHVDKPNLEVGKFFAEKSRCRQGLLREDVSRRSHYDLRLSAFVITCPVPDADALSAVRDRVIHIRNLAMILYAADDVFHFILAPQAFIRHPSPTIHVWRKID